MKTFLFLDDIRNPIDTPALVKGKDINPAIYQQDWIIVRDYLQFVNWILTNGLPDLISFDHDLGELDERTGMDCAKCGEKTIADAIMDRIIHNAHRIELFGESLRKMIKNNNEQ